MGTAQPTLANFGSATFTGMTYNPADLGAAFLSGIDMIDESGNVIATAGPTTSNGSSSSFTDIYVPSATGYWLVGSDGGIFSFGQAQFYGSTGSLHLQRPVVGIVPTADHGGYWLDASDGGVFSYGDTQFYGSIPGSGSIPPVRACPNSLNAPIVGMVPSNDDNGYFMVASDGGVFAFGDAHFAGSCPGIGGCAGAAVAVMPDASGHGYWLVTSTGNVYTFGDAAYFGAPGHGTVTSAVATPDGLGLLDPPRRRPGLRLRRRRRRRLTAGGGLRRSQRRHGHLQHLGRGGLLGLVGPGVGLQLRRRAQRRGHGGDAPQRGDHRRHGVLIRPRLIGV